MVSPCTSPSQTPCVEELPPERGRPHTILTQPLVSVGATCSLRASVSTSQFSPCVSPWPAQGGLMASRAQSPCLGHHERTGAKSLGLFASCWDLGSWPGWDLPPTRPISLQVGGSVVPSLEGCCRTCEWAWQKPKGEGCRVGRGVMLGLRGPGSWPGTSRGDSSGVSR